MSFDIEAIQRKINSINLKEDSIDNDHILFTIYHQISKIKKAKIDMDKSKFIIKNTCDYELKIISKNDQNCSFYISIFDNKIDFQLNHGGEYLYLQPINSLGDIGKLVN